MNTIHRRELLSTALGMGAASVLANAQTTSPHSSTSLSILRPPDDACAYAGLHDSISLVRSGDVWKGRDITVSVEPRPQEVPITLTSPQTQITHLHLRWNVTVPQNLLTLGDAWERSYGDLAWRTFVPQRVMPWYFLTYDGTSLHGYGVKTAANALCFWQLDPQGVSLWLDLRNGGSGVLLGDRPLLAATVVAHQGSPEEDPITAARQLCARMCNAPRLPQGPIYGTNDWYYAYGNNSAPGTLRDAELLASLSEGNAARPFAVIDMGWEGNPKTFPDMIQLAQNIKKLNVRPGIWIRPLQAPEGASSHLLLPNARFGKQAERGKELAYDPTIPEALELVKNKLRQVVNWNYELIKHDFSTYDLLGQWGNEMGAQPTRSGWSFHDRTKTNAEIIRQFYQEIRTVAPQQTIIGCNTVGHLAAGLFEAQRIGDDTSGRQWERTRRMGVNTLAYRLPQHGTFFAVDADCVGITPAIPWNLNRQWLDLLAHSGTTLFVSPGPDATGPEQRKALREAFSIAASGQSSGKPADWFHNTTPEPWQFSNPDASRHYDWLSQSGAWPFSI